MIETLVYLNGPLEGISDDFPSTIISESLPAVVPIYRTQEGKEEVEQYLYYVEAFGDRAEASYILPPNEEQAKRRFDFYKPNLGLK